MATTEQSYAHWRLEQDGAGIGWLTLDKAESTANSLSRPVLEELDQLLDALAAAPPRALVIRSGKAGGFIAGADVREFTTISDETTALALISRGQALAEDGPDCQNVIGAPVLEHAVAETAQNEE